MHNCYYEKIGNNAPVKLEDLPFDIPDNWTWIRFPNLVNFILGKTPERHNPKYWNDGKYPWFSISDMKDKQTIFETKEKISDVSLKENFNSFLRLAGTLIMSFKLTVGRVSILGVDGIHNEAIVSIFPYLTENNTIRDWLFYILGLIVEYVDHTDAIKGSTLNKQKMNTMLIPLPPLREQNRIIAKILETKPLIDKYNEIETKLSQLEQEFPEKLKKSVLQYAIEGKLVKQDPNDEPASILLERIKAEKEKLIKEGKIKRDKNESYIYQGDDKNYYENLPQGWVITTLSQVISLTSGTDLTTQEYSSNNIGVPYLTGASNISNKNEIIINRYTKEKYINSHLDEILLSCKGTIGKIVKNNIGDCHVARQFMSIKAFIDKDYLIIFLKTLIDVLVFEAKSMIPGIDRCQILTKVICLPPLNEQKLISKKIEILLNYI